MPSLIHRAMLLILLAIVVSGSAIGQPGAPRSRTISLDGEWRFVTDPTGKLTISDFAASRDVRLARVPSSWQAQFADLRDYAGVAWYWRTAVVEKLAADQAALLRFGAVDYLAEVYVNGQKVGSHEGGYLPFEFDVTSFIHPGENQVVVRVADAGGKTSEIEGIKYAEIPHGKQNWYVQTSGLWQSVELAIRPRVRLGAVHIAASADGGFKIDVPVLDTAQSKKSVRVSAEIRDPAGKIVWQGAR